jgi:hypothetical protein
MRKVGLLLSFCTLASLLWAGNLVPLNSGLPLDDGHIDSAVMMCSGQGVLFFVYTESGLLFSKKSLDNGETFRANNVDFLFSRFSNVRQLTLFDRVFRYPLAVFVADEDGSSGIYALRLDESDNLSLFLNARLDDSASGSIAAYSIIPENEDNVTILYQKCGALKCSYISVVAESFTIQDSILSLASDHVSDYRVFERSLAGHRSFAGYYSSTIGETSISVSSFMVVDHSVFVSEFAETSKNAIIQYSELLDGSQRAAIVDGIAVHTFGTVNGIWQIIDEIVAPQPNFQFSAVNDGFLYLGVMLVKPLGDLFLYQPGTGAPALKVNSGEVKGLPSITSMRGQGKVVLTFLQEEMLGLTAVSRVLNVQGDELLEECAVHLDQAGLILDSWHYGPIALFLSSIADLGYLYLYFINPMTGTMEKAAELSIPIDRTKIENDPKIEHCDLIGDRTLYIDLGFGNVLIDLTAPSEVYRSGQSMCLIVSSMNNQRIYLFSENATQLLYKGM